MVRAGFSIHIPTHQEKLAVGIIHGDRTNAGRSICLSRKVILQQDLLRFCIHHGEMTGLALQCVIAGEEFDAVADENGNLKAVKTADGKTFFTKKKFSP